MTTRKAVDLALALQNEVKMRLAKLSTPITVGDVTYDTDQNPLIKAGTGSVGAAGGLIKVKPIEWPLSVNIVGLQEPVYSQHEILFVREASVSANVDELVMNLVLALGRRGTRVAIYQSPNGTAPDASQFIAANLKAVIDPDLWAGMMSMQ